MQRLQLFQPQQVVAPARFSFSVMTRRLTAKKTKTKYKLKTKKAAARRFRVVSGLSLTKTDGGAQS